MKHTTTFRGVKINYNLTYQDGLPFADILEVSNNGQVLDLSVDEREKIKHNIYGYIGLSELFEELNNYVSADYWRAKCL